MVEWQNYQVMIMAVVPIYGGFGLTYLLGSIIPLAAGYTFVFVWIPFQPKIMKWISQGFKHKWAIIETDENLWDYKGRIQFFFKKDPASTTEPVEVNGVWQEWQSFIRLDSKHPFYHPFYNGGRPCWGVYIRHGDYAFDHKGLDLPLEERKTLSSWDSLFPDHGGGISYGGMWVHNPNSDWAVMEEIMPSYEEVRDFRDESKLKELVGLRNHVPMIEVESNGRITAYPVLRVKRAQGSRKIEEDLKERKRVMVPMPIAPRGNGEAKEEFKPRLIKVKVPIAK